MIVMKVVMVIYCDEGGDGDDCDEGGGGDDCDEGGDGDLL